MNKLLTTMTLLCFSVAANAETYVCAESIREGYGVLSTFVRSKNNKDVFSLSRTFPANGNLPSMTDATVFLSVTFESDSLLALRNWDYYLLEEPTAITVSTHLIHKETNAYIEQSVSFSSSSGRGEGSCVKI